MGRRTAAFGSSSLLDRRLSPAARRTYLLDTGEYSAARLNPVIYLEKVRPQFLSLRQQVYDITGENLATSILA
jgi:hypothetical protein